MSEKWTPGPWSRVKFDILGADNSRICRVIPWDESGCKEEDVANAHLIAAAPEMYEALKAILPYVPISSASEGGAVAKSGNVLAADKVRAALKKARGEQ